MKAFVQIYNPREDPPDVLRELFVGREDVLREILDDLVRQSSSASRQHWLIRAPRGHGKSHLAAMVYHSILENPGLSAAYQPVWLSEAEAYEVYSAGSFLERIASELVRELGPCGGSDDLRQRLESLHGEGDDPHFFDAALELLERTSRTLGKTLIVIVENLDALLNGFSPRARRAEAQRVRSMMQHDREFLFLGTTPTHYLPGLSDPGKPLYGQFRERRLAALSEEETERLFDLLAVSHGEPDKKGYFRRDGGRLDRLRVFHRLTRGSPRSVVMLFHVVASVKGIEGLVNDLRSLLDIHTAYFEARLARLPARERVIIAALCSSQENLTAKEIARRTRLPERSISTQLHRLVEEGHVAESAGTGGKGAYYEVSDGLLRLWYQFRKGRKLLEPVVHFLSYWHSPEELARTISLLSDEIAMAGTSIEKQQAELTLQHVEEALRFRTSASGREKVERFLSDCVPAQPAVGEEQKLPEIAEAAQLCLQGDFDEAIQLLERYLAGKNDARRDLDVAKALILLGFARDQSGRHDEAIAHWRTVVDEFGERDELALLEQVAMALFSLGVIFDRAGRSDEAIETYAALVSRFGGRDELALLEQVAMALLNLGNTFAETGRTDEAIETYRTVVSRFGERGEPALLERVAKALINLGVTFDEVGRTDEAIETCRAVVSRFGERNEPALLEQVAMTLLNLGNIFAHAGRTDDAIETYRTAVSTLGERNEPALLEWVAKALVNLGMIFDQAGRTEEAIETYGVVVSRFGERNEPALLEPVTKALINLGVTFDQAGRPNEAIETYRTVVSKFGERNEPVFLERVAKTLVNLGVAFARAGRTDEAIETYSAVVSRYGERSETALLDRVVAALFNVGNIFAHAGRTDEAIETYRAVVSRLREREDPALLERVAMTLVNLGNIFAHAGRNDEAIETYRTVVARFGDRNEPGLLYRVAKALVNLGNTYDQAGRTDDAIEMYRTVISRFGERHEPALREGVAKALFNLGVTYDRAGRTDDAIETYQSIVDSFEVSENEEIANTVVHAYAVLIALLFPVQPNRARSAADASVALIVRRDGGVPSNAFMDLTRSLFLRFDDPDLHRWIDAIENIQGGREIAEIARLFRFVIDVLEASKGGGKGQKRLSAKARRERALGRVPSEFRQSVIEIVDEVREARRDRSKRSPSSAH